MQRKTQREEREYQRGRRDGFHGIKRAFIQDRSPLYEAGRRDGILDRLFSDSMGRTRA